MALLIRGSRVRAPQPLPALAFHVYQVKEKIENIPTGYYIYNGEEKTLLIIARAGMEEDEGDLCQKDELIKVHQDFRDYFVQTEMKIGVE